MNKETPDATVMLSFRMNEALLLRLDMFWQASTFKTRTEAIHAAIRNMVEGRTANGGGKPKKARAIVESGN